MLIAYSQWEHCSHRTNQQQVHFLFRPHHVVSDFYLESRSRNSSFSGDERRSPSRYHTDVRQKSLTCKILLTGDISQAVRNSSDVFDHARVTTKAMEWDGDTQSVYTTEQNSHLEVSGFFAPLTNYAELR